MKTLNVVVQIKVDEDNIADLYPEFNYEFADIEDFMQAVLISIQTESDNSLNELGYSVKILPDVSLLPITYSDN
jgi:hypothetical protein